MAHSSGCRRWQLDYSGDKAKQQSNEESEQRDTSAAQVADTQVANVAEGQINKTPGQKRSTKIMQRELVLSLWFQYYFSVHRSDSLSWVWGGGVVPKPIGTASDHVCVQDSTVCSRNGDFGKDQQTMSCKTWPSGEGWSEVGAPDAALKKNRERDGVQFWKQQRGRLVHTAQQIWLCQ